MTYWFDPMVGGGGGGIIGGNAATGQPAMSSAQINAGMGWNPAAQAQTVNLYGPQGFGGQTAYYAGQGAAYGRATGGFGTPGSNPGWQDPQPPDGAWVGTGFNPQQYLQDNPDVAAAVGANNLQGAYDHARTYGRPEGRGGTDMLPPIIVDEPTPQSRPGNMPSLSPLNSYQGTGYNAHNPAIYGGAAQPNLGGAQPQAGMPPQNFNLYDQGGGLGGAGPSPTAPRTEQQKVEDFDKYFNDLTGNANLGDWERSYYEHNPDVKAAAIKAGGDYNKFANEHLKNFGASEGRKVFDSIKYLRDNPDVAKSGMGAFTHYNKFGRPEGRSDAWTDANVFDPATYLRNNSDVAAAGVDPRTHWLQYGQKEMRQGGGIVTDRDAIAKSLSAQAPKMPNSMQLLGYDPNTSGQWAPGAAPEFQGRYGMGFPNAGTPSQVMPNYGETLTSMDRYGDPFQTPGGG